MVIEGMLIEKNSIIGCKEGGKVYLFIMGRGRNLTNELI
jgi:hypothetical protein